MCGSSDLSNTLLGIFHTVDRSDCHCGCIIDCVIDRVHSLLLEEKAHRLFQTRNPLILILHNKTHLIASQKRSFKMYLVEDIFVLSFQFNNFKLGGLDFLLFIPLI